MIYFPELDRDPYQLKEKLRARGITQAQLAALLGVSIPSACAYLNGYRKPPAEIDQKLMLLQRQFAGEISTRAVR